MYNEGTLILPTNTNENWGINILGYTINFYNNDEIVMSYDLLSNENIHNICINFVENGILPS